MDNPLVSILLCVYNGEKYLKEAIDSILAQTYTNWELIIIDDGSTDSTSLILQNYSDSRIIVHHQKNMGLTKSLNVAARLAKGELFARQDADDLSMPERLEKQVKTFEDRPDLLIAGTDTMWIGRQGEFLDKSIAPRDKKEALERIFNLASPFIHGSIMIKKEVFDAIGGYNENLITSQDFDLLIRASTLDGEFTSIPEILYQLRIHPKSLTSKKWTAQIINSIKCMKLVNKSYPESISFYSLLEFILKKTIIGCYAFFSPESIYKYRKKLKTV